MVQTNDIKRPSKELIATLMEHVSAATAAGDLNKMGIRNAFIQGPVPFTPGKKVVGPALTLPFMPKREDEYPEGEYVEPATPLHRHALSNTQPGHRIVVDAPGCMPLAPVGHLMLTYL